MPRVLDVDPLIAIPLNAALSPGEQAVLVLDGRDRVFASAGENVEVLAVYLLIT